MELLYLLLPLLSFLARREQVDNEERRRQEEALRASAEGQGRPGKRRKRPRIFWVRSWLQRRTLYGQYEKLMSELCLEDPQSFKNFLRMEPHVFEELLHCVGTRIRKQDTFRKALEPGLKLAVTLPYLATGNSCKSLQSSFRVAYKLHLQVHPRSLRYHK